MDAEDPDYSSHKFPFVSKTTEELKELWTMAIPITASQWMAFFRQSVSVMFLGKLGSLELAGGALSIGFTNISGYSVLMGLASGLEPVCSQAYGRKNWDLLFLSLQQMILILLLASIPIGFMWLNINSILIFLHQDPQITAMATTFCFYSLPDLLTYTLLQPLRVFLRSQGVTRPIMYCSSLAALFHPPLNYILVVWMDMGVRGVAVASVVTNLNTLILMVGYMWWGNGSRTWNIKWKNVAGLDELCDEIGPLLRLAVPSCVGICLEWWWYEIVTVMAGYLPNPTVAIAATGILIQTTSMMYTVPMALAACVSTRVGNELGAGRPSKARWAANVALASAFVVGILNVLWTVLFRQAWSSLFTDDARVRELVVAVLPILGVCELGNCPQTTGCGILRGTARPGTGARVNLRSFYFVGTPVAVGLAFGSAVGFTGLWVGLLSAQVTCAVSILYVVLYQTDWDDEALKAQNLTSKTMIPV